MNLVEPRTFADTEKAKVAVHAQFLSVSRKLCELAYNEHDNKDVEED